MALHGSPATALVGRGGECEVLDRMLAEVRLRNSGVLVLRGEAGIGKTALLDYVAAASSGCHVVRAAGVESEMELAFAGVHQLCASMLRDIGSLPGPQRNALSTAFGLEGGDPADRFLVGLAVLSLFSAAASDRPLICLIDDAQWLDQISAEVLVFVARRLQAESVAMVFAVREPVDGTRFGSLPARSLRGLINGDARSLLDSASPVRLDEQVKSRIVAETGGNPLALLELPRGLTAAELAGGFGVPGRQPLANHIERHFLTRIRSLPDQTQQMMLVAAAEPVGDAALLRRAAAQLGIDADAAALAADDELLELGAQVRFRHPLVRSAAYRAGSAADRRIVHRALADATNAQLDPDRRAWHRAHAAATPDESVAAELERSAERAQRRGGIAAAAAFLERATELTPDPARRAGRALAAAQAKFESAAFGTAASLLATAEVGPLEDLQRARVVRLRAEIVFEHRRGSDDPPLLLDAARRLHELDPRLARETYLEAIGAAIFAGRLGTRSTLRQIAEVARGAPPAPVPPRPIDRLLDGLVTRFADGYRAAAPQLRATLEAFRDARDGRDGTARWFWLAWLTAGELWDDALCEEFANDAVRLSRDAGALAQLPLALVYRAGVHIHAGELATASTLIAETESITAATGNAPLKFASLLLAAWRGNEPVAVDLFTASLTNAMTRGEGRAIGHHGHVTAVLYNGLGRYEEALVGARLACEYDDVAVRGPALVELLEAAARSDSQDVADELRELEERALAAGTDWALGLLARSRALFAPTDEAEAFFCEAIERLARTRIAVQLARSHLLYGEWLRRERRRVDAREHLRAAHEMFQGMGAEAFTERARRELQATGETVRERSVSQQADLTPQEMQIARLAAAGHTNQEIGSLLFISARTVEWHLRKVFVKVGISTRRELRTVVAHLRP